MIEIREGAPEQPDLCPGCVRDGHLRDVMEVVLDGPHERRHLLFKDKGCSFAGGSLWSNRTFRARLALWPLDALRPLISCCQDDLRRWRFLNDDDVRIAIAHGATEIAGFTETLPPTRLIGSPPGAVTKRS